MQALVTETETAILPVGAEVVWSHLTDEERLRAWRPGVERFGDGGKLAAGEAFPIVQQVVGRRVEGEAVTVQCDAPRALSYEVGWPGCGYLSVRYELWPQDEGCKLVMHQTVDAPRTPLLGAWLGRLRTAPRLREELQRDLARLRQHLATP